MSAKNVILRKKIEGVLYDVLPKTITSQVYDGNNVSLATLLTDLSTAIAAKATQTDLTTLSTKFDNLVKDAPKAYDTLLEISSWIGTHADEYNSLVGLLATKVTAEDGKGLSTNDFTNAYKTKLDAVYSKTQVDTAIGAVADSVTALTTRVTTAEGSITTLNANSATAGSVAYKINAAVSPVASRVTTVEGGIAAINHPTTGIAKVAAADATAKADAALVAAKAYTDNTVSGHAKIYASITEPAGFTEADLWLAIQE